MTAAIAFEAFGSGELYWSHVGQSDNYVSYAGD